MYQESFTVTAQEMLLKVKNANTRAAILSKAKGLSVDPEAQGIALFGPLRGLRRIPAAGRYRIVYRVIREKVEVLSLAVGLRKQDDKKDIYELAQKLVRMGLLDSG
jgi:mRNA interferase RelE/StbE